MDAASSLAPTGSPLAAVRALGFQLHRERPCSLFLEALEPAVSRHPLAAVSCPFDSQLASFARRVSTSLQSGLCRAVRAQTTGGIVREVGRTGTKGHKI